MSHACTPILMGVVSPVSELWLLFACLQKWPKFPFGPWTIVHGHHTNFDGHDLSSFGDNATFKNGQISPSDHG